MGDGSSRFGVGFYDRFPERQNLATLRMPAKRAWRGAALERT
jgi:hypothetical protein